MKDDPRIKELRGKRNPKEDAPIVLECAPEEIAWGQNEITKDSKTYIGPLFDAIFKDYPNLECIYTSFPEDKIHAFEPLEISEENLKDGQGFIDAIKTFGKYALDDHVEYVLTKAIIGYGKNKGKTFDQLMRERREELKERGKPETVHLVRITVNDLFGDNKNHTTDQIWGKATDLGLELCPVETGPLLRLGIGKDQPHRTQWTIAHEQFSKPNGDFPHVLGYYHDTSDARLVDHLVTPINKFGPNNTFVFRLRKSEPLAA